MNLITIKTVCVAGSPPPRLNTVICLVFTFGDICSICTPVVVVQLLGWIQLFVTPSLQHTSLLCPSLSPRACSNSCPLSQWCHPTISSVTPFSCLQSFPASGSFPMSWHFASSGQSIGALASDLLLGRQLGMSNKEWSGWKGCKLISKLNHRHIQESSQMLQK